MINGHFGCGRKLFPLPGRCAFLLLLLNAGSGIVAFAQTQAFVEPMFVYDEPNIPTQFEPSLDAAWADTQTALDTCDYYGNCRTALNLHPDTNYGIQFDGIWAYHQFDLQTCSPNGTCSTASNWGWIQTNTVCPSGGGAGDYGGSPNQVRACAINLPFYPQPKDCPSCLGDPIYAGTGQAVETDTDYAGPTGVNYVRTYRSVPGRSASTAGSSLTSTVSSGFIDYTSPGITTGFCYPGSWAIDTQSGNYCFPYIGVNKTQYQIATTAGTYITFSGSASAPTQNADINDRVTQVNINGLTEWHVARDDDTVETYNTSGELLQKALPGGRTFTYTYSDTNTPSSIAPWPGLMLSESDAFGHTLSWQYNAQGFVSQMTNPAGSVYQYSYDATGNLSKVSYPDGTSKTYLYNESADTGGTNLPHALTGTMDESGGRIATFQYNSDGFAVGSMEAGGVDDYTFSYDGAAFYGNPVTSTLVTDPLGTQRTYTFQNNISLSYNYDSGETQPSSSGSGSVTQSFTLDSNANISQVTDFNGEVTKHAYDETRNLETSRTEAYGTPQARTITTQWDPNWRQPDLITEPGRTTAYTYDSLGNALTKTITDTTTNTARTWTYTYDSYGRMLTAEDPRENFTHYAYYTCTSGSQCGELETITDALGHITTYNTYDANGRPLTISDPNGTVTTLSYDLRGRLTSRTVGGETTSFSYYPTGLLEQVTLPDGGSLSYTYDPAHRLTQVSDGLGNKIAYTLDAMGNRTGENTYDPSGTLHRTHTRVINALNEIYQEVNAAGTAAVTTTLGYDNDGNTTSIDAPLSRNTGEAYDALNRVSSITDPASGITKFGYDAEDDLTSVKDPRSLGTSYGYDGFADLTSQSSPDTGTTTNTYDSAGNLATSTDARGAVAAYGYDDLNRVTSIAYSLGGTTDQTLSFAYDQGTDGIGHLTGASDANHSMSFSYDALGEMIGMSQTVAGVNRTLGYAYTNGDLTSLTTPSGQTVSYGYNANHQVTSIAVNGTTVLSSVSYEPFGPVDGWTWGNGNAFSRTFDGDGDITGISAPGSQESLGYDNASRISGITNTAPGSSSWTYGYDPLDRLTGAASSSVTEGWTYDANGNRLSETGTELKSILVYEHDQAAALLSC